jgi:hypothetical protein
MTSTVQPVGRPHEGIWNSRSYKLLRELLAFRHRSSLDPDAVTASANNQLVGYMEVRDEVGKVANEQKRNCVHLACTGISAASYCRRQGSRK